MYKNINLFNCMKNIKRLKILVTISFSIFNISFWASSKIFVYFLFLTLLTEFQCLFCFLNFASFPSLLTSSFDIVCLMIFLEMLRRQKCKVSWFGDIFTKFPNFSWFLKNYKVSMISLIIDTLVYFTHILKYNYLWKKKYTF